MRRRTPTRIQMEAAECGAVALAIVLEHHGHVADIEAVRAAAGVSRDGINARQLLDAARQYGMEAAAVRAEPGDLTEIPLPAILHWEFNHFVVLEAVRGDAVYINDPAIGPRRLTRKELDAAFTGIALILERGPDFKTTPPRPSIAGRAWERLSLTRPALWLAAGATLALLLPNLLVPAFSGIFTDKIVIKGHAGWLHGLLAAMLVVALLRAWTTWQREQHLLRAQTQLATGGTLDYMRHTLSLPLSFFQHRYAAEIASRASLNDSVGGTLVQNVATAVVGLGFMLFYGLIMAQYDLGLTLLAAGFALLSMLSLHLSQRLLADGHRRVLVEDSRLTGLVNRGLAGIEETAAAGTNELVFKKLLGQQAAVTGWRQAVMRNAAVLQALQHLLATLGLVAVLIKGGYDIMDGVITVGMMLSFQGLMSLFGAPVAQLLSAGTALQDVRGNMERLDDVLHHPADPLAGPLEPAGAGDTPVRGDVEFRDISFGYNRELPPLIDGFDLRIAAGSSVAIVGASGCGKSTLARMLAGQLQPWAGDVRLDGVPLDGVPRARRCAALAHVDQEVQLLSGSVQENITLWDPAISPEAVAAAARDALVEEFISARPGGLTGKVAEDGADFSGGERQRLEIARALARQPRVLLLDEATSALDPVMERTLLERILARGITVILISHRLAPLRLFDRIVVLREGRICQDGSYDRLMASAGPLRELVEA